MAIGTAPPANPVFLGGLARRLVADKLISDEQAREAQQRALKNGTPFVSALLETKTLSAQKIAEAASIEFGAPLIDLTAIEIDPAVAREVSDKVLRKVHALPLFKRGRKTFVAVSDPTNLQALDEIKFATGNMTEAVLVEEDKLVKALESAIQAAESQKMDLGDADLENLEIEGGDEESGVDVTKADADDAPIVRYVNKVFVDAINLGASDVHFEPYEKTYRIRYRKDGELKTIATPPQAMAGRLAARVKVMSRLDLAERRVPQDGRIKLYISKTKAIDFRVSTCPTLFGEKIVLRILDASAAKLGIDKLGYEENQKKLFLEAIEKPYGMVLVTGPTGSGKTTTLYSALSVLNDRSRNIMTVEDPIEYYIDGVGQTQVNTKVEMTFARGLRAILRQDPDVVMIGEIRDLETAEIAVQASQTGHLVLSTLHTNTAVGAVTRLRDMGVEPYQLSSSLIGLMAQRLVRQLCRHCKEPYEASAAEKEQLDRDPAQPLTLFKPVGCPACRHTGYLGRTGVHEVIEVDRKLEAMIHDNASEQQLEAYARSQGPGILQSGRDKVVAGQTTLREVLRVTIED